MLEIFTRRNVVGWDIYMSLSSLSPYQHHKYYIKSNTLGTYLRSLFSRFFEIFILFRNFRYFLQSKLIRRVYMSLIYILIHRNLSYWLSSPLIYWMGSIVKLHDSWEERTIEKKSTLFRGFDEPSQHIIASSYRLKRSTYPAEKTLKQPIQFFF